MRWMVGLFGLLCGAVVVWTVANYGYTTADDPAVRWNMAFLFGVIATAGLFGHAVSVRIWSISRVWSIAHRTRMCRRAAAQLEQLAGCAREPQQQGGGRGNEQDRRVEG